MAQKAAQIRCPNCGETVSAPRLDWPAITEEVREALTSSAHAIDDAAWAYDFGDPDLAETIREEKRLWREERRSAHEEFAMGPYYWNRERPIHYYRRVRKCSNCNHINPTAEVDEELLAELDELRDLKLALASEAARAASAVTKIRRMLKG